MKKREYNRGVTISRRALLIIGILVAIAIIVAVWITWQVAHPKPPTSESQGTAETVQQSKTRLPVPADAQVPDLTTNVPQNVAKPEAIVNQAGGFKYRSFDIQ